MKKAAGETCGHVTWLDWNGLVVICSGTSWDGPKLSDRHLAERFTNFAPVLWVDPPISLLTPLRRRELRSQLRGPKLQLIGDRLVRLTPVVTPGMSRPGLRGLAMWATRRSMARAVAKLGGSVHAVVVGSLDDLFGACGEERRLLWGTDDFAAAGELMGVSAKWLARRETAQLRRADTVCAVSRGLAAKWTATRGEVVTVIPNGCDTALFAGCDTDPMPSDVFLEGPIAVFVGHLSERIDLRCLEAVADGGTSLLLVGPRQSTFDLERVKALLARPNVQWVGPKPFLELGSYLRVASVGLTPYTDSAFNRSSFPLKTLEYLAAGRPVVSTDLPAARDLGTDLITIAPNPESFAIAVADLAARPGGADFVARAREFAAAHDWNARVEEISDLLNIPRPAAHHVQPRMP